MNKYYKNFILCGDIDQYCLVCKESFHLILDIEKHIRWEKHRKNIKELNYLPKFQKEFIYKIETSYYCEKCNLVLTNMASVKEHIKSDRHELLKNNPDAEIKKPAGVYNSGFAIINKVVLNKAQWHSIVDNKCLICDIDVGNVDEHTALPAHIIKWIQSETKYSDNHYYRKINKEIYHCFACKNIFTENNFGDHWLNCDNNCEAEINKLKDEDPNSYVKELSEDINKMTDMEKQLRETLGDFYDIDGDNDAKCKYCYDSVTADFKTMLLHMKEYHSRPEPTIKKKCCDNSSASSEDEVVFREFPDYGQKRSDLAKYGKSKYIKLNYNASKGFCTLCNRFLAAHKSVFRLHSHGSIHRGHLELLGLKKPKIRDISIIYITQSIIMYLFDFQYSPGLRAVWINNELSVDINSFFFLYVIPKNPHYLKTKCYACDEVFNQGEERIHCLSSKHKENFMSAKIIMKLEEFIRELRPNLYHCGYCNNTFPFSQTLETHLRTLKHNLSHNEKRLLSNMISVLPTFNPSAVDFTSGDEDLYVKLLDYVYG